MTETADDDTIYLASPPSERKFIAEIASKTVGRKVLNGEHLAEFLESKFSGCDWYEDYLDEVVSLVEQAILAKATYFIQVVSRIRPLFHLLIMQGLF